MKSVRYSLIYKFFAAQISFGYYQKGDYLPSIDRLTKIYHASSRTAYNAYRQLQEDGYIALSAGRKTSVVYEATPEECRRNYLNYYMARKESGSAFKEALRLLLLPLMREGCRRLGPRDMRQIGKAASMLDSGDYYFSFFCCNCMLNALRNRLALSLFHDAVCFYQFPHTLLRREGSAPDAGRAHALAENIRQACEHNDPEALFAGYQDLIGFMDSTLYSYMTREQSGRAMRAQIPFEWRHYRAHPQLCYSLSARLIGQIYIGQPFAPGEPLPYYGELAKAFGVSFSTIRRTMDLLEKLGVVATAQGAGTKVAVPKPDVSRFRYAQVLGVLSTFREVIEILTFCFDSIAANPLASGDIKAQACMAQLRLHLHEDDGIAAFVIAMNYLFEGRDCFRGIWDKLYEDLLLGLPLVKAQFAAAGHPAPGVARALIANLEAADAQAFRHTLKELTLGIAQTVDKIDCPGV